MSDRKTIVRRFSNGIPGVLSFFCFQLTFNLNDDQLNSFLFSALSFLLYKRVIGGTRASFNCVISQRQLDQHRAERSENKTAKKKLF